MAKYLSLAFFFLFAASFFFACNHKNLPSENPTVWNKVKIDFSKIDEKGLAGPPNGKVAVSYEFCIPAEEKFWNEVKNIDNTAQIIKESKGRIGCDQSQWLVIGSTYQANYKRVIYELASLNYVAKIQETFFE